MAQAINGVTYPYIFTYVVNANCLSHIDVHTTSSLITVTITITSLPDAGIVADERRRQGTAGGKDAGTALIVTVRVDSWYVFHLVEAVCFFVWELELEVNYMYL